MSRLVFVLNGPNLNLLGKRQPHIYGHDTMADVEADCRRVAAAHGLEIRYHQSNREYEIIDWVHEAIDAGTRGIVVNPAGYSFTSIALVDALKMFPGPIIELHITNIHRRDPMYRHSLVSGVATAVIAGLGARGYAVAVRALQAMLDEPA